MAKPLKKRQKRLAARISQYEGLKNGKEACKRPGSMNKKK